jgi:hypothetical protein
MEPEHFPSQSQRYSADYIVIEQVIFRQSETPRHSTVDQNILEPTRTRSLQSLRDGPVIPKTSVGRSLVSSGHPHNWS